MTIKRQSTRVDANERPAISFGEFGGNTRDILTIEVGRLHIARATEYDGIAALKFIATWLQSKGVIIKDSRESRQQSTQKESK